MPSTLVKIDLCWSLRLVHYTASLLQTVFFTVTAVRTWYHTE